MKSFAIFRSYGYLQIEPSTSIPQEETDQRLDDLSRAIKALYEAHGVKYICADTRFLAAEKMSVRVCEGCDNLMINRDKNPAGFDGSSMWADATVDTTLFISDGGTYRGRELCMECLPTSHRWGLFS